MSYGNISTSQYMVQLKDNAMKVLVTGSTGLIGSARIKSLSANGHEPIPLLRKKSADSMPFWDPENGVIDLGDVAGINSTSCP